MIMSEDGRRCFELKTDEELSRDDAQRECAKTGLDFSAIEGSLARIDSPKIQV